LLIRFLKNHTWQGFRKYKKTGLVSPFFKKVYAYTSAQQGINHKSGGVKTMEEKIKFFASEQYDKPYHRV